MKELIPIQGEYKKLGWDAPKRDAVLADFVGVIKNTQLIGFGWGRLMPVFLLAAKRGTNSRNQETRDKSACQKHRV